MFPNLAQFEQCAVDLSQVVYVDDSRVILANGERIEAMHSQFSDVRRALSSSKQSSALWREYERLRQLSAGSESARQPATASTRDVKFRFLFLEPSQGELPAAAKPNEKVNDGVALTRGAGRNAGKLPKVRGARGVGRRKAVKQR